MKRLSKRWPAIFGSAVLVAATAGSIVWACGGGDWDDTESSDFAPEVFVNKAYTPFFYSENFYYDVYYDTEHDTRFNDDNVRDWTAFINRGAGAAKFIDYVLNKADEKSVIGLADFAIHRSGVIPPVPDSVASAKSIAALMSEQTGLFLQYAALARGCESFALSGRRYSWDERKAIPDSAYTNHMGTRLAAGLQMAGRAKNSFLTQRFWFQLVRYHYFYEPLKAFPIFKQYESILPKNHIYYRTMAYAAGALYKQQRYAEANYYYSLVFAGDDKLKTVAHWSFHPQEDADWKGTLALCKTPDEQAACWQMLGIFYKDELRSLKAIYALDPTSPRMDLLLTRLINAAEDGNSGKRSGQDTNDIKEAYHWTMEVTDAGKVRNGFLWAVSTGYIAFLNGAYTAAHAYYAKAAALKPSGPLADQQLRLLQLLASVGELKRISADDERRLLPELQWLFIKLPHEAAASLRYQHAITWTREVLAKDYEAAGDIGKAECFVHKVSYFGNDGKLQAIQAFLDRKDGLAYNDLCRRLSTVSSGDIDELKAVKATLRDDLASAVKFMSNAPGDTTKLYGNPFNARINDCHDCDHTAPQKVKYSKLDLLHKLQEMEGRVAAAQDIYNNALLLGNAFYNLSFYGNARHFSESRIIEIGCSPDALDSIFQVMLLDNSRAGHYYKMALAAAATDEQRAKSVYMLAKCERNNWYTKLVFSNPDYAYGLRDEDIDKISAQIQRNWFAQLKPFSGTKYYQEVIKECGYFRKYVAR